MAGRRRYPALGLLIPGLVLAGLLAAVPQASACTGNGMHRLLDLVNTFRAARGLGQVSRSTILNITAGAHAAELARRRALDHVSENGDDIAARALRAGYDYRVVAENLASGPDDPADVLALWIGSPGHLDNLLETEVRDAGIACVPTPHPHGAYWVLVLGVELEG